jgi:hypothetical protein
MNGFSVRVRLKLIAWSAALFILICLGLFLSLEVLTHRPSPVHATLIPAEIAAEDAYLQRSGLTLPEGSLLKSHPFESPWTSRSLLVPSSWFHQPGLVNYLRPHRVRADLLLADLDTLQPVMQRAYDGWDTAAARGWDWNQWFSNWRKQLTAKDSTQLSFDEAFAPIDALIAFQRDNHTQIPLIRNTASGSQTATLATAPTATCTEIRTNKQLFPIDPKDAGQQVRTAKQWTTNSSVLADTHYIAMPTSYGAPQAVHCGSDWIPLQPIGRPPNPISNLKLLLSLDNHTRIERLGDGVVYARLPTFVWSNYDNIARGNWPTRQPGDHVLIVDLRNNSGNSEEYGHEALKGWIDETRIKSFPQWGKQVNSSCLYAPLKWGYSAQTGAIRPGQRQYLQSLLDLMAQPYPPECPRSVNTTTAQWIYPQHHFAPRPGDLRIIALVNNHCGSDCEAMLMDLASLPETIVAGDNTFGVGQFIQPGYSFLPHTGLMYRIALGNSNLYGDNRSVDGYGLDVDIVLPQIDSLKPAQLRELAAVVAKL